MIRTHYSQDAIHHELATEFGYVCVRGVCNREKEGR